MISRRLWAIRIAGIGDANAPTAANKLYRWPWGRSLFDDPAAADPDGLYLDADGGTLLKWPREVSFGVDFRNLEPRAGAMSFELRRNEDVLGKLLAGVPPVVARLTLDLGANDTTIRLDTSGLTGSVLHSGRECLKLGAEGLPGVYDVTGLRGLLGTQALTHKVERGGQWYGRPHPTSLYGRLVELVRVPLDSDGYYKEDRRWVGIFKRIKSVTTTAWTIQVSNLVQLVLSGEIYRTFFSHRYGQPRTGRTLAPGMPTTGHGATFTNPGRYLAMVGDKAQIWDYRLSADPGGISDARPKGPFMAAPEPDEIELGEQIREFFSSHPDQPVNAAEADTNTLPLRQNPGEGALQLLLTTRNGGEPGPNDLKWDTGIDALAGGIQSDYVDLDNLLRFGARHAAHPLDALHVGHQGAEAVALKGTVQDRIFGPRGGVILQGEGGQLQVLEIADSIPCGSTKFLSDGPDGNIRAILSQRLLIDDALTQVKATYNDTPGLDPDVVNVFDDTKEDNLPHGVSGRLEISAHASRSEAAVANMGTRLVEFWHDPVWEYQLEVLATANVWPGDVVPVTHKGLVADGVKGLVGAPCLVFKRQERIEKGGHVDILTMFYVGERASKNGRVGCIGSAAEVDSWDDEDGIITCTANAFTDPLGPVFVRDAETFFVGDKVRLLTEFGELREGGLVVGSVNGDEIELVGLSVVPAPGDLIVPEDWSEATEAQRGRWAWIADANNQVGGGLPFVYAL